MLIFPSFFLWLCSDQKDEKFGIDVIFFFFSLSYFFAFLFYVYIKTWRRGQKSLLDCFVCTVNLKKS